VPASAIPRFALLLTLWVVLAGPGWAALPAGLVAAALGTWWSLALLPPSRMRVRVRAGALAALVLRFPWQAVSAGAQVARLALDPRARVAPATIAWSPRLPPGRARDAFLAYASLLPGTLPCGEAPDGAVLVHAISGAETAAAAMTLEEARFMRAFRLDG